MYWNIPDIISQKWLPWTE